MDIISSAAAGEIVSEVVKNEKVIEKTANVLGKLFPYFGLHQKAVDLYIDEIEKSNMSRDAKVFCILHAKKEIKRIKNQKDIVQIAIENAEEGTDFSEETKVSDEWLERFMDSAKFVSEDDIKLIWGKILAAEFEMPGSTPPNMTRILSELTPSLAKKFGLICSMNVSFYLDADGKTYLIRKTLIPYTSDTQTVGKVGLSFNDLNELDTLGLIKFDSVGYTTTGFDVPQVKFTIGKRKGILSGIRESQIPIGNVRLSSAGEALKKIIEPMEIDNYFDIVMDYFTSEKIIVLSID